MALNVNKFPRVFTFKHNGEELELPDPNPTLSPDEVMGYLANFYGELTNATVDGPVIKNDKACFTFKTTMGTKG